MQYFEIHGKSTIVITSIFPPTKAVTKFAQCSGYNVIVIGDKKTPRDWQHANVEFFGIENQSLGKLSKLIPYNSYNRKMYGYLQAIWQGADVIVDTDDDNIPYSNFPQCISADTEGANTDRSSTTSSAVGQFRNDQWQGSWKTLNEDLGYVNIYQYFSNKKIWPRGLPLPLINTDFELSSKIIKTETKVGIWQGLADGDPDVDAIYRLVDNSECIFDAKEPVVLAKGTICPFNSQNTATIKDLFPLLYLPITVTFRFTDILRGLIAQPIMWASGYTLGFTSATVYQERNPHNYMKDFESEVSVYIQGEQAMDTALKVTQNDQSVANNLFNIYDALEKNGIVHKQELTALNAWLEDLETSPL